MPEILEEEVVPDVNAEVVEEEEPQAIPDVATEIPGEEVPNVAARITEWYQSDW